MQVPIYQQSQSSNGAEVLLGAILGGLAVGTATESDKGAAIGALGGAIIAGENSKKNKKIVGFKTERHCGDYVVYHNSESEVYSHSTIRFYIDDKRYVLKFMR